MKTIRFAMILVCGLVLAGCTVEQIDQASDALADANSVAEGLAEFATGPGGMVLPPVVRTIMELFGVSAAVALGLWKQIRHNLTKETLKAVTKGVDAMSVQERDQVKAEIGLQMNRMAETRRSVTYSKLNAELDKAKVKA